MRALLLSSAVLLLCSRSALAEPPSSDLVRATDLLSTPVGGPEGSPGGNLSDILVDAGDGRVINAVLQATGAQNDVMGEALLAPSGFRVSSIPAQSPGSEGGIRLELISKPVVQTPTTNQEDVPVPEDEEETVDTVPSTPAAAPSPSSAESLPVDTSVVRLADWLQAPVVNEKGDRLGTLEEFALERSLDHVLYGVVSGVGVDLDSRVPVPWPAMSYDREHRQIVVKLDPERFADAPAFDSKDWARLANRQWGSGVYDYFGFEPSWKKPTTDAVGKSTSPRVERKEEPRAVSGVEAGSTPVLRISELVGATVKNLQDEELGTIRDLALDPDSGQVAYVVLAVGGFLGIGQKLLAVPWEALTLSTERNVLLLNVERGKIERAQGFDPDRWPSEPVTGLSFLRPQGGPQD